MANVFDDMDKILQNEVVERHTYYQLKFFVVGSEPTNQSKMQCCLRELKTRRLSLENIQQEVEDLKDKTTILQMELEKVSIESATDERGIDLMEIDDIERFEKEREIEIRGLKRRIRANERQVSELGKKFKYITEECQFFVTAFRQVEEEEELKPWDSLEVQKEYWDAKLGKEFKSRIILGQPLDREIVKAIEQLHDDADTKQQVMQLIQKQNEFNKRHMIAETKVEIDD